MTRIDLTMQGTRRDMAAERLTLTIEEAGRALGIGRNSAFAAAHRGEIPIIKIGRRLLVPRAAFERMLAEVTAAVNQQPREARASERFK